MIVAFGEEEEVEAFGEKLTLRLDFRAGTYIEGVLEMRLPEAVARIRNGAVTYNVLTHVLWAMTREHNSELSHDQLMTIVNDRGPDGLKVGVALDTLLERAFPIQLEDRKPKNAPRRNGRSKTSAAVG